MPLSITSNENLIRMHEKRCNMSWYTFKIFLYKYSVKTSFKYENNRRLFKT